MPLQQDRNHKPQISEFELSIQRTVNLPVEVAFWLVDHSWTLEHDEVIDQSFDHVPESALPSCRHREDSACRARSFISALLKVFCEFFGLNLVAAFVAEKGGWCTGGKLCGERFQPLRTLHLLFKSSAKLARKIGWI